MSYSEQILKPWENLTGRGITDRDGRVETSYSGLVMDNELTVAYSSFGLYTLTLGDNIYTDEDILAIGADISLEEVFKAQQAHYEAIEKSVKLENLKSFLGI